MLGVDDAFGVFFPPAQQCLDLAVVVDRLAQDLRLLLGDVAVHELARAHATPLVVRTVARARVAGAAAVGLATLHHALGERSRAQQFELTERGADASVIQMTHQPLCPANLGVHTERLGPLPLINHFVARMGLHELLERHVPTSDGRSTLSHAQALGVLLRSIVVEREPVYRQQETAAGFAAGLFGVDAVQAARLSDDRIGRALDRLFDADRAALLTEVVLAVAQRFALGLQQLHNDSTSISLCGQYPRARGRRVRARSAPAITYGYSKDHRPDLEQLLFILTTAADGGVPVQFRCADGNTTDVLTHVQTWDSLRALAGRADFLYVADSKLCSHDNMTHIARAGGHFGVTPGLLPRIVLSGG